MKIKLIYIAFLLISGLHLKGQSINGHVMSVDEKGAMQPVPGANVVWLNTNIGTTTNGDGFFTLELPADGNSVLTVSYVGFKTDTIDVTGKSSLHIMLTEMDLGEVVIIGETDATTINTVGATNMETINKKELLKAACCNLSESFETNNTVDAEFSDAVTGAKTIKLLGLDGVYSQIMMENMPGVRGLASSYGLNYIPGPWIESIQITKGPGSVVNGYESITGSINTEIKKPFDADEEMFLLNLYGSNSGRLEANINYKYLFNEKWSTAFYTHTSQQHLKLDDNDDGFLDVPLNETYIFMNKWNYFSGKKHEAQFGAKYISSNISGGQVNFNDNAEHTVDNGYGVGVNTTRFEGFMKNGFVFDRPNTSIGTILNYSYHDQNAFFGLNEYRGRENYVNANFIFQSFISNTNHQIKTGASFMMDDFDEEYNGINYLRTEYVPGVFFEYQYKPDDKLSVLAGMRADHHNLYGMFYSPRLHVKYGVAKNTILRGSVGKGYRVANVFVENTSVLTSSRPFVITESLLPEQGWNYGLTAIQKFEMNEHEGSLTLDGYRTDFINQVVVDMESDHHIYVTNLHGDSYSNVLQAEVNYEIIKNLDFRMAYKYIDARETINDTLLEVPLTNKNRGLANISYKTPKGGWVFDITSQFYGSSRLPQMGDNPEAEFLGERSEPYMLLLGQITKKFKWFDIYAGSENITNYTQQNPIIDADDPFGEHFDASVIYAPVMQRKFYAGFRMILN
ncbi:MAG: TonB-dependent receptor domain-containing protein [Chitinophagales bacterium]